MQADVATDRAGPVKASEARESAGVTIGIIGAMFFIFGFVTWLNGPLIAFVKVAFALSDVEAFLVPMAFYMSYFFLALPSAALLRLTGMKKGMAMGLAVMAIGAVVFGQCATILVFPGALAGLFIIGTGLAIMQTAANPYISVVGPIESAAQRIAVMGICNKVAGIIAPILFGILVMRGVGEIGAQAAATTDPTARQALLSHFAQQIYLPYMGMAALLAVLAAFVFVSPLPEIRAEDSATADRRASSVFDFPHLWLGVICLFLYVGVEVMAGDAIGTYGRGFGLPIAQTAYFTSLTLVGMLIGYLVGLALIPRFVSQGRYLAFSAALGCVLVVGAFLTKGYVSVGFVAALGFANAMMWPAIFPLAIRGLGRQLETGSAMMIMAICGGAIIPQAFAILKQSHDFQTVFALLMLPAYAYIFYFAVSGSKVGMRTRAAA